MKEIALRRNVAWLIAFRVVITTILLGSATIMRVTVPGSFAVDPFFFLIGLTYALTIGYALALRFVERHRWLVLLQLGVDAVVVSAFIYFTAGLPAISRRCTCCRSLRRARSVYGAAACWWRR